MGREKIYLIIVTAAAVSGLMCSKGDNSTGPFTAGGPGTVAGTVTDRNGMPVSGVAVQAQGGGSTATGPDGSFTIPVTTSGPTNRAVLQLSKLNFFTTVLGFVPSASATTNLNVMLSPKQSIGTASAGAGVNLAGSGVTFATGANSFVNDSGAVVSGNVTVNVSVIDPADTNFGIAAPGGDFLGTHPDGGDGVLGSNGMVFVGVQTASGASAQLAPGATATVSIPASEAPPGKIAVATPPDSVGVWELGANGIWDKKGTAYLSGGRYTFVVAKLGVFNCGRIVRRALVRGTLCAPFIPSSGEPIRIGLLTTQTDARGGFNAIVPAGDSLLVRTRFGSAVIGPFTQGSVNTVTLDFCDTVTVRILSPASGSTVTNTPVTVTGTVSDPSVTSGTILVNGSPRALPVSSGAFAANADLVPGSNIIRVEILRGGGRTAADQVVVNFAPASDSSFVRWNVGNTQYSIVPGDSASMVAVLDTTSSELFIVSQDRSGLILLLQPTMGTGTFSLGDFESDTTSWGLFDTDDVFGNQGTEYVTTPGLTGRATINVFVRGTLMPGTVAGTFTFNGGLVDSVLAGSQQVPSVAVTSGVFRVPLFLTGSTGKRTGAARIRELASRGVPDLHKAGRLRR